MIVAHLYPAAMLALLQSTQLNLFERFLTQARAGIDSTGITSGMQNVGYVVLLVGFLWQVYHSALHGGDVRGLGASLIKYVVTAVVLINYGAVFSTINQGFVNAGNWVSAASGGNVFENWASDLKTQYSQAGFQQMWGLITGSIAGLIDGVLVLVAYILYPVVVVVFGFFYMFYGSILYIFGPIVIALMPLGGANRLAKSYVENIFVWNAWPILYGGFGALLTAVQMGQVGQMLNQNDFLGGLGNLEGSFLLGIVSIVYSLAIAVIPFVAKRIVSGDVGSTAAAMVGVAVTALSAGVAGVEGAAAGVATAGTASSGATSSGGAGLGPAQALPASTGGNVPTPPQHAPAQASVTSGFDPYSTPQAREGYEELNRNSIKDGLGANRESGASSETQSVSWEGSRSPQRGSGSVAIEPIPNSRSAAAQRRGPSVHRFNLGTWGAYHAGRIAAAAVARATKPKARNSRRAHEG